MRVLVLHSRYVSNVSGENLSAEDEARVLRDAGHAVFAWTPSLVPTWSGAVRAGIEAVWSRSAVSTVKELVREHRIQIVHCHNLFPTLSPAVLDAAHAGGAGVVVELPNYRLLCIAGTMVRGGSGCQACLGRAPWRGVVHRCYRESVLASGAMASSLVLHRLLGSFDKVGLYLAVSRFVRDVHVSAGFEADRITVKPNFSWPTSKRDGPGDYFAFLGRLTGEKGISTLIEAWRSVGSARLYVAGDGPSVPAGITPSGVEFLGRLPRQGVQDLIRGARAVLVPSNWHEPFGRVVVEAYASGVPVVASRMGGLQELVREGQTGYLVDPEDAAGWADAICQLKDDALCESLGSEAWALWKESFTPEHGLAALEQAYQQVLGG